MPADRVEAGQVWESVGLPRVRRVRVVGCHRGSVADDLWRVAAVDTGEREWLTEAEIATYWRLVEEADRG